MSMRGCVLAAANYRTRDSIVRSLFPLAEEYVRQAAAHEAAVACRWMTAVMRPLLRRCV